MTGTALDSVVLDAVDTVMRVAHNLRREGKHRPLTAPECAVMATDLRMQEAGWTWTPDGPQAPALAGAPAP